jgi:hypothetical protein
VRGGIVEVVRYQGGLAVIHHVATPEPRSARIGHYYSDLASYKSAVDQAKRYAAKVGAEYLDAT